MKTLPVLIGTEEIVFSGKLIEIIHQKMRVGDHEFIIEKARRAPGTRLIILSPDKKILLTKEYRMELHAWDVRLPGGKVLDSLDEYREFLKNKKDIVEKAQKAAIKEAREEVGLAVEKITYYTTSHCGATMEWDIYYFIVSKYHELSTGQHLEIGEHIKLTWVSLENARTMCLNGTIQEDRTVAVLLQYISSLDN